MIKFEKVSFEQFKKDTLNCLSSSIMKVKTQDEFDKEIKEIYDNIKLPTRATKGSAGYDFYSPFSFTVNKANEILGFYLPTVTFPTGIRCMMDSDVCLLLMPKSGIGFKTGVRLANTVGLVDSDYFFSDNEGHIMVKFVGGFNDLSVERGQKVMQGIFTNYFTVEDDDTQGIRNGGFGSTDK